MIITGSVIEWSTVHGIINGIYEAEKERHNGRNTVLLYFCHIICSV